MLTVCNFLGINKYVFEIHIRYLYNKILFLNKSQSNYLYVYLIIFKNLIIINRKWEYK